MNNAVNGVEGFVGTSQRPCSANVPRLLGRTLLQLTWANSDRILLEHLPHALLMDVYIATYVMLIGHHVIYYIPFVNRCDLLYWCAVTCTSINVI